MPKNTKNTKKTKSSSSLFSKISLKSRKGKMLLLTLVMVAVGAGIIIRSFAATQAWGYNLAAGNLVNQHQGGCNSTTTYDSQFKANIISLYCPKAIVGGGAYAHTRGSYLPGSYTGSNVRFCSYVKGTGTVEILTSLTSFAGQYKTSRFTVNSSNYGYYCTSYIRIPAATYLQGSTTVLPNGNVQWVNVGGMVLEKQ